MKKGASRSTLLVLAAFKYTNNNLMYTHNHARIPNKIPSRDTETNGYVKKWICRSADR